MANGGSGRDGVYEEVMIMGGVSGRCQGLSGGLGLGELRTALVLRLSTRLSGVSSSCIMEIVTCFESDHCCDIEPLSFMNSPLVYIQDWSEREWSGVVCITGWVL